MTAEPDGWKAGLKDLSDKVEALVDSCGNANPPPARLYHFTDCAGVVGILKSNILWASLATSLSDASETKYAIARLGVRIEKGTIRPKHLPAELLLDFLSGSVRFGMLISDVRAYVVSFCGGADEAIHWLHYGRSGTGVAIGVETACLTVEQFNLCSVIYDESRQDDLLSALVDLVDDFVEAYADRTKDRSSLDAVACHLTTVYLRFLAPRLKSPAFTAENEWRLITNEAWSPRHGIPTRPTLFRTIGGRVVPFKEVKFDPLPVAEIVLGASSPMKVDEQAIAVLMENTLGSAFPVRRSTVPVRP